MKFVAIMLYTLFAEIIKAFSSSPVPAITTEFTTNQISIVSTTDSQQFSITTEVHHIASVSSVKHTRARVVNVSQLSRSEYLYSNYN